MPERYHVGSEAHAYELCFTDVDLPCCRASTARFVNPFERRPVCDIRSEYTNTLLLLLFFLNPRYQGCRGICDKINIRNCWSNGYSGQSSRMNKSLIQVLLYRCNKTEIH